MLFGALKDGGRASVDVVDGDLHLAYESLRPAKQTPVESA